MNGDRIKQTSSRMIEKDKFGNVCQERVFVVMMCLSIYGVENWPLIVFVIYQVVSGTKLVVMVEI